MVFDNLNFFKQMPHQIELWGRYSEQISEYYERGLMEKMLTERGRQLVSWVDPYSYRARYTMPILMIQRRERPLLGDGRCAVLLRRPAEQAQVRAVCA
jgi:PhoPQ-activated pathogenicity-related protein